MTPRVAAIMPCRGRTEQTVQNVKRLLATAGYDDWELWLVGTVVDMQPLVSLTSDSRVRIEVIAGQRLTYWNALARVTLRTDAELLCNLANDLIPGMHWLKRAVEAYDQVFHGANDYGLLGFNGDSHETEHSCHFLIASDLLTSIGGWPTWYDHNFGDTELCQKTIALGFYAKAPYALLFHDHPYFGGTDDEIYREGRASSDQDQQLYETRRRAGWPTVRS